MTQPSLVSSEVLRRIRHEQTELVRSLEHVQRLCEAGSDEQLCAYVQALHEALQDHVGRVDSLLRNATGGVPARDGA